MSVPLDRLYHYIKNICKDVYGDNVLIYRFYPYGSKKHEDLEPLETELSLLPWKERTLTPELFCNDQEPLNFEAYNNFDLSQYNIFHKMLREKNINLRLANFRKIRNIWDKALLLHSEQRSVELDRYQNSQFIPAYYWSHALIALDWFRFAQHCEQNKKVEKTFLIYNRAWAGTREYRLKFADLLLEKNLQNFCQTTVNAVDPDTGMHYTQHKFKNPIWKPDHVLEAHFSNKVIDSHYSADFDLSDYETSLIEVVLETLFDDGRLHLTEKSLRPIACGQPFILATAHGSLEYLKNYGFKTFDSIWNEDYDKIQDPKQRLDAIVDLMNNIAQWDESTKKEKMQRAQDIADYNKKYFFSEKFFCFLISELKSNMNKAFQELKDTNTSEDWLLHREICLADEDLCKLVSAQRTDQEAKEVFEIASEFYRANRKKNYDT